MTQMVPAAQTAAVDVYQPTSFDHAFVVAERLLKGRLAMPKGVDTPEAVVTIMMTGAELGMSVMQSLRSIHVFTGRPTLAAELQVGLVKKSAACKYFQLLETTDKIATYETQRHGEQPTRLSYTFEQAQKAGLVGKDNWRNHPASMLRARASAALCRAVYPDVTLGILSNEEARDGADDEHTEAPRQINAEQLQARVTGSAVDGEPAVSEQTLRDAFNVAKDIDAMKSTAKDFATRFPAQQKTVRTVFDAVKKERQAASKSAESSAAASETPKSEPVVPDSDGEPPADVVLSGDGVD